MRKRWTRDIGMAGEAHRRALSENGNPSFAMLMRFPGALDSDYERSGVNRSAAGQPHIAR